mgnify:CR=1 FL=1
MPTVRGMLLKKLDQYYERFNDAFPSMELPYMSDQETINKINECLNKNVKADLLFGIKKDKNIKY